MTVLDFEGSKVSMQVLIIGSSFERARFLFTWLFATYQETKVDFFEISSHGQRICSPQFSWFKQDLILQKVLPSQGLYCHCIMIREAERRELIGDIVKGAEVGKNWVQITLPASCKRDDLLEIESAL